MTYSFLDHTGDAGLEVTASSLPELFSEALRGMTDTITDVESLERRLEHRFELRADALDLLLRDFLDEALARFDIEGELYAEARLEIVESGSAWSLDGLARGDSFDPERHPEKTAIKAVTYHQLSVERRAGAWRARIIFDL